MTAVRVVRLWCDYRLEPVAGSQYRHVCGKEFDAPSEVGFIKSMPAMRAAAAKAGWTYVPCSDRKLRDVLDQDYCPEHKPEG